LGSNYFSGFSGRGVPLIGSMLIGHDVEGFQAFIICQAAPANKSRPFG
jgi:hypothetical protein